MNNVRWIVPEAMEPAAASAGAAGIGTALKRQIRLGLLDNSKDNAQRLLALLGERVQRELDVELIVRRKGAATLAAPPEVLEELAREADCILTAMAD